MHKIIFGGRVTQTQWERETPKSENEKSVRVG